MKISFSLLFSFCLTISLAQTQFPEIAMKFDVREMTRWNGVKFEQYDITNQLGGFAYTDSLFYVVIGNELKIYKAAFIDVSVNYDEQYVEQKWYLNEIHYPRNLRDTQIIAFTRRKFDAEVTDFYWLTLIQYPEKKYGLFFTVIPENAKEKKS